MERRETRGCHNRSDYPDMKEELRVNLVWSPATGTPGRASRRFPRRSPP
ncbi:hypothetical protein [Streptomyces werraensis]